MAGPSKVRALDERERMDINKEKIIAKRGDVRLQPGKDGKPVGTLLVSSVVLSLASPVFEAMFNENFAEGQDLSVTSPKRVELPEDEPYALQLLCLITHLQTDDIPDSVPVSQLADFAIVCDKYQCTKAVEFWSKIQIAQVLSKPWQRLNVKLFIITYLLDLPKEFSQVTLHYLREVNFGIRYEIATHETNLIPLIIIDRLRFHASNKIWEMRKILWPKTYEDLLKSDCEQAGNALKAYLVSLANANIHVTTCLNGKDFFQRAPILEKQGVIGSCSRHENCAVNNAKDMNKEVARNLIDAYNNIKPCCMDCMRIELCGMTHLKCRLNHRSPPSAAGATGSSQAS